MQKHPYFKRTKYALIVASFCQASATGIASAGPALNRSIERIEPGRYGDWVSGRCIGCTSKTVDLGKMFLGAMVYQRNNCYLLYWEEGGDGKDYAFKAIGTQTGDKLLARLLGGPACRIALARKNAGLEISEEDSDMACLEIIGADAWLSSWNDTRKGGDTTLPPDSNPKYKNIIGEKTIASDLKQCEIKPNS